MSKNNRKKQPTPQEALRELWRRGDLNFLLHEKQKEIKRNLLDRTDGINVIFCARRFGKTYMLLNMAMEVCVNKPNAIVKYLCPEKAQGVDNIQENMRNLLENCPEDLKPRWYDAKSRYIFPNGSQIQVQGTDNKNYQKLRGGSSDMCIVDEAGFCSDLDDAVMSVLFPTTFTTNGKIYLVSTPSQDPTHEFMTRYVEPNRHNIIKYTIYDNPMLNQQQIERIINSYPLKEKDPKFKRECLCEEALNLEKMVVGEFREKEENIIMEWKRPPYYDAYTSGDIGYRDLTVYLIGYYDFLNSTLVIEDELVLEGIQVNTKNIADGVREKEERWVPNPVTRLRYMDNDLKEINNLISLHQIAFLPTEKHNKDAHINRVKLMIINGQLKINPRCKTLIYHLRNAMWKDTKSNTINREFEHLKDATDGSVKGGHADALDALIYMVRNVMTHKNPYPEDYDVMKGDHVVYSKWKNKRESDFTESVKKIMNFDRLKRPKRKKLF